MATKGGTPNQPQRPQGLQQRRILFLIGALGIAALAIVLAVVFHTGGDDNEQAAVESGACTVESFPALPNIPDHSDVPSLTTKPQWNSNPPTSGPHYGEWVIWGFYDEEVPLVKSVHNLEHGGVVIHYGPQVPQSEVEKLRAFWGNDPNGILVAALPSNGDKITLSAWTAPDAATGTTDRGRGWLARCSAFDEDAFATFVEEHRYMGPERIPPDALAPGS